MEDKHILMTEGEIEEALLSNLMKEVAVEAKAKAANAKQQMQERIALEIEKAEIRYKARHT